MSIVEKALNHSKKIGIDECEIVLVKKKITTVRITDSEIAEIKQNFDESYGIRIIHQKKIASSQSTDKQNINKNIENIFDEYRINIKRLKTSMTIATAPLLLVEIATIIKNRT